MKKASEYRSSFVVSIHAVSVAAIIYALKVKETKGVNLDEAE